LNQSFHPTIQQIKSNNFFFFKFRWKKN
jgi:hypothetical protein